jgi:hypothetical protein
VTQDAPLGWRTPTDNLYDLIPRSTMTTTPTTLEQAKAELAEIDARLERQAQRSRERAARRSVLIKRQNEVARLVEQLSTPAEPNAKHVSFKKQFHKGGKVYEYGAVKADGYWYVTGGVSPQGVLWRDLVEFIRKDSMLDFYVGELCPPF